MQKFLALSLFLWMLWAVQSPADEGSVGSLALPGAHRTLADLLREAEERDQTASEEDRRQRKPAPALTDPKDWKWESGEPQLEPNLQPGDAPSGGVARPQAVQAPAPAAPMELTQLTELIQQRNTAVNACDLFNTLSEIVVAEKTLRQLVTDWKNAVRIANAAIAEANMLNNPGANLVSKAAKQSAENAKRNALQRRDAANQALHTFRSNTLQPLYKKIQPHLGDWMTSYRKIREFVIPRCTDPNHQAVIGALEQAVRNQDDFFEGRVLAACCLAYQGQLKPCHDHLDNAHRFIEKHYLAVSPTLAAHDCAVACIVAGIPAKVERFIQDIKKVLTPADASSAMDRRLSCCRHEEGSDGENLFSYGTDESGRLCRSQAKHFC